MAFTVDTRQVKNRETVCYTTDTDNKLQYKSATYNLAWGSMAIDIGDITKKNYREVYFRHKFISSISNYKLAFTLEDVKNNIGLSTNVAYNHRGVWKNRIIKDHMQRLEYQIENEEIKNTKTKSMFNMKRDNPFNEGTD
tara:strand:+ start:335 stop:751 length:417 start_codon:yes stop_codon:yes gene_type:complete